ncbi:DUF4199 domain-containing protein [Flavobacterium sp.]|uniref:DUF4199 domain-containing protein n=1 Tax=Flavobacterium sp. TaxID=239 RepID=UPI0037514755
MNEVIKKNAINYGLIIGSFSILLTTIIYSLNVELFLSGWISFFKITVYLTLFILLLSKTKKELKGIFTFKDAFTTYFIASVIGILLATLFEIILFNLIDPSLKETLKEMSIKFTAELLEKFGTPTSEINKAISEIEKTDQFSLMKQVQGLFMYFLIAAIFGFILAAIFKSKTTEHN